MGRGDYNSANIAAPIFSELELELKRVWLFVCTADSELTSVLEYLKLLLFEGGIKKKKHDECLLYVRSRRQLAPVPLPLSPTLYFHEHIIIHCDGELTH